MATGTTIKIKRKAGALVNGELAEGELGLDTVNDDVYASTDGTTVFLVNAGGGASTATESAEGVVELATLAEAQGGTENGAKAVRPSGLPMRKVGTAWIGGDMTGNARGTNALDIQSGRGAVTKVASGNYSSAVGYSNTASESYSSAIGYTNTASGASSSAFGKNNTASGNYSTSFGNSNTASAGSSSAFGYQNTASGLASSAFGYFNNASGSVSSAFGAYNNASGSGSSAVGYSNTASGLRSSAIGYRATASTLNSVVVGRSSFTGTGLAHVSLGILNNQSGGSINFGTGEITGTPAAANSGHLSTAVGIKNISSGGSSSTVGNSNTASGTADSAVGYYNNASGNYSSAFGYYNNASGSGSSAVGNSNNASGSGSSAVGYYNYASGNTSSAVGYYNTASGTNSSAFGYFTKTTVANTVEVGYWSSYGTVRSMAVRMHPNGQIAMTIEDSATAPTDGGATLGSEADGTLARGMFAIQKNGTAVTLYYNNAGTIQSLSLGTLA